MKKLLTITAVMAIASLAQAAITPIDSTNNIGFISVVVPATNVVIISVPFEKCQTNSGSSGMLSDLISTNGLISHGSTPSSADQLIVLTTNTDGTPIYFYYWLKSNVGWSTNTTTVLGGTTTNVTSPNANAFPLSHGMGFWLKRPNNNETAGNLYMKGQIPTTNQPLNIKNGLTLIGLGGLSGKSLNDPAISWGAREPGTGFSGMDKLIVVSTNGTGSMTEYYYHTNGIYGTGKWCTHPTNAAPAITSDEIQPGYGFWFLRRGASDLTFKPVVP